MHSVVFMSRKRRRWLVGITAFVAAVLIAVFWIWRQPAEPAALRRMTPDDRTRLYQQTYAATRTLCDAARTDDALHDRCASWAEFLLDFPECDSTCREFATPYTPRAPSR